MKTRIESLDWQRGLLACSIMVYHLTSWELHPVDSSSLLGRLGIYGVSMFFVLSGLSMAVVYSNSIRDVRSSISFFIRRIFRIWPLLWAAVTYITLKKLYFHQDPSWRAVLLNLTTTFGFIRPQAYLNTGAWSIGNEMVYYALTPLIVIMFNRKVLLGNILTGITLCIALYFAFVTLKPEVSLANQWITYINPFNNLFLYSAGIAIYYNTKLLSPNKQTIGTAFALLMAVLAFYPVSGDQINIVTGFNRIVFLASSILLVIVFFKNTVALPSIISSSLTKLGEVTYGVYLLHPIVYDIISLVFKKLKINHNPYVYMGLTIVLTIILALVSYQILEKPLIRLGKKLTSPRVASPQPVT
jgi:exopolysaccharide production protein ExoZ